MDFGIAIKGLIHLLDAVGDHGWQPYLQEHLETWERTGDASSHRSIYGGMGSFNDLIICGLNKHKVTPEQEPWANSLLMTLSSICYTFATGKDFKLEDLKGEARKYLQGWLCCDCSHAEITERDIDTFISQKLVNSMILQRADAESIIPIVDDVIKLDIPGLIINKQAVREKVKRSGISLGDYDGWMRPCPSCGSSNTRVYRWADKGKSFKPASN